MITVRFKGTRKKHTVINEETLGVWIHALDHAIMTCDGNYEQPFLEEMQEYFVDLYDIIMQSERPRKNNGIPTETE